MAPRAIILFALSSLAATVFAQGGQRCGPDSNCPASAPCCSEYGFCGNDHFCLGGCNPLWSRRLDSCRPNPICKDATHTFPDLSRILSNNTLHDGNATAYDWVVEGGNALNTNLNGGELALILTKENGGTKISSTRYVHYGKITARMKTGRWPGVVTAFITMSDAKDEIDFEWPGAAVTETQLNYFWLGVANYSATHGSTVRDLTDTYANFHDYTIDWQPERLRFLIDGTEVRVIEKSSTANPDAGGRLEYPSTPARVQLSLWPAGIESSAQGTVEWAGGMIDWTHPDYVANGQFQAIIQSVTIECYDNQNRPANASSYVYGANDTMAIPTVQTTNATTLLNGAGSLVAGGLSISLCVFAALLFSL